MTELKRSVGLVGATVYGTGLILGAGIYAVLGEAVAETGESLVLSFLLASVTATLTGLSYAELSSRYPRGEGEYLYVRAAFRNKRLAELTAFFRALTGVISAAAVALAFSGYLRTFTGLPVVPSALVLVGVLTFVNYRGIEESVRTNLVFTLVEVAGLLLVVALGVASWGTVDVTQMVDGWAGVVRATFLIFFAYVGFEAIVNLADETEDPSTTVPRAIGISILLATVVYLAVGLSALGLVPWQELAGSPAPLALVAGAGLGGGGYTVLTAIALFATANTVLILLVSTSRLIYGVSREEYNSFPAVFARVHPEKKTPYVAVALVAAATLPFVLLDDLGFVAELANFALLVVFAAVNASLLKLRYQAVETLDGYRAPLNVGEFSLTAAGGLASSVGLLVFYLADLI